MRAMRARGRPMNTGQYQLTKTERETTIAAAGPRTLVAIASRWEFFRDFADAVLTGLRVIEVTLAGLTQTAELVPVRRVSPNRPLRHRRLPEAHQSPHTGYFAICPMGAHATKRMDSHFQPEPQASRCRNRAAAA